MPLLMPLEYPSRFLAQEQWSILPLCERWLQLLHPSLLWLHLLDIPEGTVLTDASNNEYYIRQLRPRIVYAEASLSQCATLTIGSAKETNDHTFFNYPVLNLPRVGAVLVNKLSNEPSKDIAFNGNKWIASEDDDSDGILNSLDMFPINALKNKDVDFDGIEDSEDGTLSEFQFNWTKYLDKSMFSAYEKDKLN